MFDLDETLVNYNVEADLGRTRPGAVELLRYVYEVLSSVGGRIDICTRGTHDYAAGIATLLEAVVGNGFRFGQVVSREMLGPKLEKSLAAGGWDGNNVVIVDDTPEMWTAQLAAKGGLARHGSNGSNGSGWSNRRVMQVEAYQGCSSVGRYSFHR